jgi:hypothetical protein
VAELVLSTKSETVDELRVMVNEVASKRDELAKRVCVFVCLFVCLFVCCFSYVLR